MLTIDGLTIRNGSYVYSGPGIYGGLAPGACILSREQRHADLSRDRTLQRQRLERVRRRDRHARRALHDRQRDHRYHRDRRRDRNLGDDLWRRGLHESGLPDAQHDRRRRVSATSASAFSGMLGGGIFGFYGVVLDHSRVTGVIAHVSAAKIAYAKGAGVGSPNTVIMTGSTVSGNEVHGTPGHRRERRLHLYERDRRRRRLHHDDPAQHRPRLVDHGFDDQRQRRDRRRRTGRLHGRRRRWPRHWSPKLMTIANSTISGNAADVARRRSLHAQSRRARAHQLDGHRQHRT